MATQHILLFGCILCSTLLFSCGGEKPATPEQSAEIQEAIDSARTYMQRSKRFLRLGISETPEIGSAPDLFASEEKGIHLVSQDVIATLRGDSAEILFGLTIPKDSTGKEKRDAVVRMIRNDSGWRGRGVYIVE
ncbi:MAG: hypothetical protein KDD67_16525 [Ignavibacteriae bacterium]|nr:hypothetical protein [Ignavibacteriota bacterium]MCB9217337.1 hypothetical protein [Ignavibacteria bacterium]